MKLILVDPMPELCAAWTEHFNGLPHVEIVNGRLEDMPSDCIVSPANSFGLMDGGVDAAIIRLCGLPLMQKVQRRILDGYLGEQPVGTSFIIETENRQHWHMAHTPTMRVPMSIAGTDAVYRAMWAMLRAVSEHNDDAKVYTHMDIRKIDIVACPGLGTLTGRVPPQEAARQMAAAYRHFLNPPTKITWEYAMERQREVAGE